MLDFRLKKKEGCNRIDAVIGGVWSQIASHHE